MFKWIYDKGVEYERERIKRLIAEFSLESDSIMEDFYGIKSEVSARKKKEINERIAAQRIINRLIQSEWTGGRAPSPAPIDSPKAK
jgi:hypothetical protein